MGWVKILLPGDVLQAVSAGRSGAPPAAMASDIADFIVPIPYQFVSMELRATMLLAPSGALRVQIRRSTDNGGTWSDYFGFVDILGGARSGASTPPEALWNEGDLLNLSVTIGGGSGENLVVLMLGRRDSA